MNWFAISLWINIFPNPTIHAYLSLFLLSNFHSTFALTLQENIAKYIFSLNISRYDFWFISPSFRTATLRGVATLRNIWRHCHRRAVSAPSTHRWPIKLQFYGEAFHRCAHPPTRALHTQQNPPTPLVVVSVVCFQSSPKRLRLKNKKLCSVCRAAAAAASSSTLFEPLEVEAYWSFIHLYVYTSIFTTPLGASSHFQWCRECRNT